MSGEAWVRLPGVFGGHPGSVFALAYSPAGDLLASGGWDGTVRLWDAETGEPASVLPGHAGAVRALAFSPDGATLISAGRDRTVRRWDLASGTHQVSTLEGLRHAPESVGVSFPGYGSGPVAVGVKSDGTVWYWDDLGVRPSTVVEMGAGSAAAAPPWSSLLAVGRDDGTVSVWSDRIREQPSFTLPRATDNPISTLLWSPAADLLAAADAVGEIHVWNTGTQSMIAHFGPGTDQISSLAFSADGGLLAVADAAGRLHILDLLGGKPVALPSPPQGDSILYSLAFRPDGGALAAAGGDGGVRVWRLDPARPPHSKPVSDEPAVLTGHVCEILSVASAPTGDLLATGDVDGVVRLWETRLGELVALARHGSAWVRALVFSPDGGVLAAGIGGAVLVWRVERGAASTELVPVMERSVDGDVTSLAFDTAADRTLILYGGTMHGAFHTWFLTTSGSERDTGRSRRADSQYNGPAYVAVAPDHRVAVADGQGFWFQKSAIVSYEPWHREQSRIAFGTDGSVLAAGTRTGVLRVYDFATAEPDTWHSKAHTGSINALVYSDATGLFATGGDDGLVKLWRARTGELVRTLTAHLGAVRGLAFAPDGVTLTSVGDDGRIIEWNSRSGARMRGSGQIMRRMPRIPGLRDDGPSALDRLGVADDVRTLATLIAAAGTRPPLAIALLGAWGSGKSSVMLQVEQTVAQLAARSQVAPASSLFVANIRQVRFNAWHYSDDSVWTGLIGHLFRVLAEDTLGESAAPDPELIDQERRRLRKQLDAKQQELVDLSGQARGDQARAVALAEARRQVGRWRLIAVGAVATLVSLAGRIVGARLLALVGIRVEDVRNAWQSLKDSQQNAQQLGARIEHNLAQARRELADLQDRYARIDAATRLARLLEQRGGPAGYGGLGGLVGQVRRDLEQLQETLAELRVQSDADAEAEPPLERIVLYIDDLDRCSPERVVEVLAAVHLMLALPLFVVVVAVDPRWMLQALRGHHGGLLRQDPSADARRVPDSGADALDYLDKIFQIPFSLTAPGRRAMGDYLRSMLVADSQAPAGPAAAAVDHVRDRGREHNRERGLERSREHSDDSAGTSSPETAPDSNPGPDRTPREPDRQAPIGDEAAAASRPRPTSSVTDALPDLRPGSLVLQAEEAAFAALLAPLLPTPRAAKKLANLYRLARIGIAEADLPSYISSGEYRPVQILLAVLVGTPQQAPALFAALLAADADDGLFEVLRGAAEDVPVAAVLVEILSREPKWPGRAGTCQSWCARLARYSFHTIPLTGDGGPRSYPPGSPDL